MSKMKTLNEMNATELLAWAESFRNTIAETALGQRSDSPHVEQELIGDFPPNAVAMQFLYGFQRKYSDRVGSDSMPMAEKIAKVRDMIVRHKLGDIGRAPTSAVSALVHECRLVLRAWLRKNDKALWAKHKNDEPDELNAWLDAIIAKPTNGWIKTKAEESLARKQAERAENAAQIVDIDL